MHDQLNMKNVYVKLVSKYHSQKQKDQVQQFVEKSYQK